MNYLDSKHYPIPALKQKIEITFTGKRRNWLVQQFGFPDLLFSRLVAKSQVPTIVKCRLWLKDIHASWS